MAVAEDEIIEEMVLDDIAREVAEESAGTSEAERLEAEGCWPWYEEMFGREFVDACGPHHRQAIEWHWNARTSLIARLVVQFLAYFSIWARGNMKTTVARRIVIADACLSTTAGAGGYALIVGGTKKKVRGSAASVETLLHSPQVKRYYPTLSQVKRNERGASKGWTADYINTEAGYVFHFIGLDEGVAGANVDDIRPTLIVPDDIDDREDSPVISEARFQTFTRAVLPTRQANTLVFFAQNLISRFSCMYRIWKQHARVLTNRLLTDPVPAVLGLVTETRTVNGVVKDVVVAGGTTWHGWDLQRVQEEIDTYGLPAFRRECQHEVEQDREGLVLQHWNDAVHVISRSEFAARFGVSEIPRRWYKYVFNDWARTKTARHANVAGVVTVSGQNEALPGCAFLFHPMSFPAASAPEDVAVRILSAMSPTVRVSGRPYAWKELARATLGKLGLERFTGDTKELLAHRRALLAKVIPQHAERVVAVQNYQKFRMSHEREDVRGIYRGVFGLPFQGVNPGADGGVDTLNLLMRVDYSQPHPFRVGAKGHCNFFVVVEDDPADTRPVKRPIPFDEMRAPEELTDADLLRYQFKNWRYRDPYVTVRGETEGELVKMSDDFGNGLMMLFHDNVVQPAPLNEKEEAEQVLPDHLHETAIPDLPLEQQPAAIHARQHWLQEYGVGVKKEEDEGYYFDF